MVTPAAISTQKPAYEFLVARVRLGDEEALARLIEHHRASVISIAANILRDRIEAEDVAQEAFLRAYHQIHKLQDDRSFRRYLSQITIRLCIDRLRRRRAVPAENIEIVWEGAESSKSMVNRMSIEKVLAKMPLDLRTTLVLREIQQLDYAEIAEILEIPIGTVRSRLHVARERFRVLWKGEATMQ